MGDRHEAQVRSWGFGSVFTWSDGPNSHYPPHSHGGLTTHLIVEGEMTLWYPNEADRNKVTYGVGSRVDVEAGRVHEVWIGSQGCTYVIGE
ncbi:uncharacterized protein TRIVIDRAFT_42615 [Trichoderma virens Gv29-8]|uniref:Cupin 2 conserved barrel domain-containing protein n=1 Tax=Hypocrea virens (strain Gv29-8 / FGSC 10586) TaxID=413071 RepID=G9N7I6_HYPVG|nr:uncharacterized protein TRIVIDRAFT_42615 [Trichoderma virens Gv29-8]EHK16952.1 hypothetical protein TRIVIDRAFT_42615 [Trichoderma virens Gv29-8]UKZ55365.1 hypothetical protein TrVGV298_009187 [Trichoderma virens]UKZ81134.1 hypothetical protein TrVFT333_008904 [Trichoderma virens FT-333]